MLQGRPGGKRLEQVLWAASGSEAIQKALWAALARDRTRDMILATRYGFHGKKGLAGAVTGSETDRDRDPRVRFISFPDDRVRRRQPSAAGRSTRRPTGANWTPCCSSSAAGSARSSPSPTSAAAARTTRRRHTCRLLQSFCREHDIVFILDEVQANFGRTGDLFAFETYGLEPDIVVLGKGLGNGVPVAAAVGRADLFGGLDYGEGSDTWSANPLCCAAVLATLDEFAGRDVLGHCRADLGDHRGGAGPARRNCPSSPTSAAKRAAWSGASRCATTPAETAAEWANACVLACYRRRRGRRHPPARPAGEEGGPHRPAAGHHGGAGSRVDGASPPSARSPRHLSRRQE